MKERCETCNGTGVVYYSCCTQEPVDPDIAMCPVCKEHLGEEDCEDCKETEDDKLMDAADLRNYGLEN